MTLLEKVKANLIIEHSADDALLESYITAAVSYAESYQHIAVGYYSEKPMFGPMSILWTKKVESLCHFF